MSTLFTFPGQAAQQRGMLHALPEHREVRCTIEEASDTLGRDALALDDEHALRSTVAVQLCLLVAGVAAARVLRERGCEPDMVAGMSIGAYPAAVTAGALGFGDAVRLVALRGRLMETAYPAGYGMTAILGLTQRTLETLIADVRRTGAPVYLANLNAPQQIVVAGSETAMQRLSALAYRHGAQRCERLRVAVPSHCALLDEPAAALAEAFGRVTMHAPRTVYLSGSFARPLFEGGRIAADLAGNMARPVRWHETARLAWERGARLAIEMPPGGVLTKLTRAEWKEGLAVSAADADLDTLRTLAERERADAA